MKKRMMANRILGILLSAAMIMTSAVPAFAEDMTEALQTETTTEAQAETQAETQQETQVETQVQEEPEADSESQDLIFTSDEMITETEWTEEETEITASALALEDTDYDIANVNVAFYEHSYTGSEIETTPYVYVENGSEKVRLNILGDYTLCYENNVNAGMATVILTGTGKWHGTLQKSFEILPLDLEWTDRSRIYIKGFHDSLYAYGPARTQDDFTLDVLTDTSTGQIMHLKEGTDYTVSYRNNTLPGTATMYITGKGNYTGTIQKTFTLKNPYSVKISASEVVYNGKAQKPAVQFLRKGSPLSSKWFTLQYSNNTYPGIAKVVVKGKGEASYFSKTLTFTIKPAKTKITRSSSLSYYSLVLGWNKLAGVTGYQIAASKTSDFKEWKSFTQTGAVNTKYDFSGLKMGSTVYFKVRGFKKANGKTIYGAWSPTYKAAVRVPNSKASAGSRYIVTNNWWTNSGTNVLGRYASTSAAIAKIKAQPSNKRGQWFVYDDAEKKVVWPVMKTDGEKLAKAVEWAKAVAADSRHGYCCNGEVYNGGLDSSYKRWGSKGDYSCSTLVITAYELVGLTKIRETALANQTHLRKPGYTYVVGVNSSNLDTVAKDTGNFVDVRDAYYKSGVSSLKAGDILIAYGGVHTVMYVGGGRMVEAAMNEIGVELADNPRPGDSTGNEIHEINFHGGWKNVMRLVQQ